MKTITKIMTLFMILQTVQSYTSEESSNSKQRYDEEYVVAALTALEKQQKLAADITSSLGQTLSQLIHAQSRNTQNNPMVTPLNTTRRTFTTDDSYTPQDIETVSPSSSDEDSTSSNSTSLSRILTTQLANNNTTGISVIAVDPLERLYSDTETASPVLSDEEPTSSSSTSLSSSASPLSIGSPLASSSSSSSLGTRQTRVKSITPPSTPRDNI